MANLLLAGDDCFCLYYRLGREFCQIIQFVNMVALKGADYKNLISFQTLEKIKELVFQHNLSHCCGSFDSVLAAASVKLFKFILVFSRSLSNRLKYFEILVVVHDDLLHFGRPEHLFEFS